ncbi:MAG: 16S rRNA (adenine(1518)-N(6)/adenine(1519)-N(6))-dimethyltransferase RsmA [Pseudomonadota bacterium]
MAIDGLPPLREVVGKYDLNAQKSLGQNFLFDLNLTLKIARLVPQIEQKTILEIGPGPGGLTRALLHAGAKRVIAIEQDERFRKPLDEVAGHHDGRLSIHFSDALKFDFASLGENVHIVANLPYNVGTVLLTNWLEDESWPPWYSSMTLMFQREVANRIVAERSTPAYGRLSVLAQWRCHAARCFDIPASAFFPPPKVTSSVVQLMPLAAPIPADLKKLQIVTKHAFGQRRKMLRQSLKPIGGAALLATAGIEETRRAETLDMEEFCRLANSL